MKLIEIVPDREWFCPLLNRNIAEGQCVDINYQRVGLFAPDVLGEVMSETNFTVEEISTICMNCPNQPLSSEDYEALLVRGQPID